MLGKRPLPRCPPTPRRPQPRGQGGPRPPSSARMFHLALWVISTSELRSCSLQWLLLTRAMLDGLRFLKPRRGALLQPHLAPAPPGSSSPLSSVNAPSWDSLGLFPVSRRGRSAILV